MKRFISFSGGVESTTMCLLFGKGATAIFSDTGFEHEEMYKRLENVEQTLKEHHNGDFEIVRVRNEKYTLPEYIQKGNYYMSSAKVKGGRFCTGMFKIQVIDKFLSQYNERVELMIGLNADEDREGNYEQMKNVDYTYPLQDIGMTRFDCIELLEKYELEPRLPPYMRRGGCIGCPFKTKKEYKAMVHLALHEIMQVAEIEKGIQDKRDKYFKVKPELGRLSEFIQIEQNNLFGDLSEYYDFDEDFKPCGLFCHR